MVVYNDRLYLDADLYSSDRQLGTFRHWKNILDLTEKELRARGVKEYFAIVSDLGRYRFAKFFGFKSNLEVFNDKYEVVRKELF